MDIVRPIPLGDQIAGVLRREIITGELTEDAKIREEVLAERFTVSRGPIRDALKQLETEHLVARMGRSYSVLGLTDADIDEIYAIRRSLEGLGWTVLVRREGEGPQAARTALKRMRRGAETGDVATVAAADVDFHGAVVRASGLQRLVSMWDLIEPSIRMILQVTNVVYDDLPQVVAKHERLLEVAEVGDPVAMDAALNAHLRDSRGYLPLHDERSARQG